MVCTTVQYTDTQTRDRQIDWHAAVESNPMRQLCAHCSRWLAVATILLFGALEAAVVELTEDTFDEYVNSEHMLLFFYVSHYLKRADIVRTTHTDCCPPQSPLPPLHTKTRRDVKP